MRHRPHPTPSSSGLRVIETLLFVIVTGAAVAGIAHATGERSASPDGAKVTILSPANGAVVSNPVTIQFGLAGMGVAPAGIDKAKTGPHHLLIDTGLPDFTHPIPSDEKHRHFGGGQTQTVLELSPGQHTLQLLLGDHLHMPHDPPVTSEVITITVE
jgi:hypothetical protein